MLVVEEHLNAANIVDCYFVPDSAHCMAAGHPEVGGAEVSTGQRSGFNPDKSSTPQCRWHVYRHPCIVQVKHCPGKVADRTTHCEGIPRT